MSWVFENWFILILNMLNWNFEIDEKNIVIWIIISIRDY